MPTVSAHTVVLAASEGSFLIKPGIGLMIWTLIVFFVTFLLLKRFAFPRDQRARSTSARNRSKNRSTPPSARAQEADKLLAEYRERLKEARAQADEIVQRARQAAETHEAEGKQHGQELIAEAQQRAEREIQAATRARALRIFAARSPT